MIVIDTSVLAEIFISPETGLDHTRREKARTLFQAIENNTADAILSEVAIHECYYVVVMRKKLYTAEKFAMLCRSLLHFPGWRMSDIDISTYIRALEIVSAQPKLEFSDAVIAARAEAYDAELATFDTRLAKAYSGRIWSGE